MNVETSCLWG